MIEVENELGKNRQTLTEADATVNRTLGELQAQDSMLLQLRASHEHNTHDINNLGKDLQLQQDLLETKVGCLSASVHMPYFVCY